MAIGDRTVWENRPFVDDKGSIWLAFSEKAGKDRTTIFLTRSSDNATTWETPIPLTDGKHQDSQPAIAVYGKYLYLAFRRQVPKGGFAKPEDVRHQIWYGWKAVGEITFPDRVGPAPAADKGGQTSARKKPSKEP